MEVIEGMTPDKLRAMADEMEAKTPGITSDEHERALEKMWEDAAPTSDEPKRFGYMRRVEIDGIPLDVDMRVVSDIRTLRLIRDVQKDGDDAAFKALDLFDRVLGDQRGRVEAALADADGYCPADAYLTFCTRIFEAVGAKN